MTLNAEQKDPFEILLKTKWVLKQSRYTSIHSGAVEGITKRVDNELANELREDPETHYGLIGNRVKDMQRVFIQTCMNFCFWSEQQNGRWEIRWKGENVEGGWYGLVAAVSRAIEEGVPILDAQWLATELDEEKFLDIFRSENDLIILLVPERVRSLREAGRVLVDQLRGAGRECPTAWQVYG